MIRFALQVFAVALLLAGGLWTLQGLGLVSWPASSFMIGQREWAGYGLVAVAVGLLLLWLSRRRD